jgi:probable F420-dependent oxidoreductase
VAAATKRINLATGILILPQRNPLVLAKECATLDVLSGGRLILGIGVGWLKEEFDALGFPFAERAATTDEHAAALRAVWSSSEATFNGTYSSFDRVKSNPKPYGGRSIPIHVGGHTEAAARRAGRLGDGFFPASPKDLPKLLDVMRGAADDAGRDADAIEITTGAGRHLDDVKALADLGVHRASVSPMGTDLETIKRNLGAFSETVVGPLS